MTDDERHEPDEAERLRRSAFPPEEYGTREQYEAAHDALLLGMSLVSFASTQIGWDLDGRSAVRALILGGALDALPGPGKPERLEELIGGSRDLDSRGFFAELEDAWQYGREKATEGEWPSAWE